MTLLGTPLLVVLGLLTIATPAAAYLLWRRVTGPAWVRGLQRWAMVVVAQLCAVLFVATAGNDYGQIFGSWSQLFAAVSAHGSSVRSAIARADTVGRVRLAGAPDPESTLATAHLRLPEASVAPDPTVVSPNLRWTDWSRPAQRSTRGAIAQVVLGGGTTGLAGPAYVYLPAAYFAGDRRLPVVEVFTGYPGSALSLIDRLHYPEFVAAEVRRRRAVPMVLVMARPAVTYPRDTECTDVPQGPQAFTYWAVDAPRAVARIFALHPTSYGAIGDSTGGYCAVKLAMLDPARFPAAVSLSGYFNAEEDATTGELFGGSARVRQLNDLRWRLAHLPAPHTHVFLGTSTGEIGADGYRSQQRFFALVHAPMSAELFAIRHGFGHTFATWTLEIPAALTWLSWHLVSAPPGAATPTTSTPAR